jgi:hypothetical protein
MQRQTRSAENYAFGGEVAVFKVAGKMLALVSLGAPGQRQLQVQSGTGGRAARPRYRDHGWLPPQ